MASTTHSADTGGQIREDLDGGAMAAPSGGQVLKNSLKSSIARGIGAGTLPFYLGFFVLAVLGLLGMSPWLVPDFYDNVTYFETARSLLSGDGYRLNGEVIADWPPLLPVLLASLFAIGGVSVVLAKSLSLAAALVAICLAYQLVVKEKRGSGGLAVGVLAVLPTSLLVATRVSSDWTFAALCFGFLLAVSAMRERRGVRFALWVGVLLGMASLTRYPGVLLGAALVASAVTSAWRARSVKAMAPEAVAALTGFLIWGGWMVFLMLQENAGAVAVGNYEAEGAALFSHFDLLSLAVQWSDLLFQWENIAGQVGLSAVAAGWVAMVPVALMAVGFGARVWKRALTPSDWFVVATLCLLVMYYWKVGRYFIPIAPFLLCYLLDGARILGGRFGGLRRAVVAVWVGALLAINLNLLFLSSSDSHGPISPLASTSAGHFYRGEWSDLYFAGEYVRSQGGGVVALDEDLQKYALPWFGTSRSVDFDAAEWDYKVLSTKEIPPVGNVVFSNTGYRVYAKEEVVE